MDWAMMSYCREIESERERDERMSKRLMDIGVRTGERMRRKSGWGGHTAMPWSVPCWRIQTRFQRVQHVCIDSISIVCVYISSVQVFVFVSYIYVVYTVVIFRMFCSVNQTSSSYESSSPFFPVLSLSLSIHYGCWREGCMQILLYYFFVLMSLFFSFLFCVFVFIIIILSM